jgi:hypothetical protein
MGSRAGLDDVEERKFLTLQGLELQFLCRHCAIPAHVINVKIIIFVSVKL